MLRYLCLVLFLGCVLQASAKSKQSRECAISVRERKDCGFLGIDQAQCLQRGCCWAPCENCDRTTPWCYFSADMLSTECLVPSEDKDDCGYYGITQTQCLQRGCCWRPSTKPNDPWCFHTKEAPETSTPEETTTTTTTTTTTQRPGYEGQVRLDNGMDESYYYYYYYYYGGITSGRLEIYHDGEWGTVCDDGFNDQNAEVVCRQLGLYGGSYRGEAYYGEGTGQIWMDQVACTGNEYELSDCPFQGWGSHDCSHGEDVSVFCDSTPPTDGGGTGDGNEGDIRLVDGYSENEGRLEVYHEGEWGTVCDDGFGTTDGEVVCRQLGYSPPTAITYSSAHFGQGSGSILLDDMNCAGHEERLVDCSFSCWGCHNCGHSEDVGVECTGELGGGGGTTTEDGALRLAEGSGDSPWSGRIEIYHDGQWGTICDDAFDVLSAQVACRQLGLSGGDYRGSAYYGQGSGPTWLDGVYCTGLEERLVDCPHEEWGYEDCSHSEDLGLICEPAEGETTDTPGNDEIRLVNGNSSAGRVEIQHDDVWGTVCDDFWDDNAARVVCRMIGFGDGSATMGGSFGEASDSVPIWLDDVQCNGTESSILECSHMPLGDYDCSHTEDAGVVCYNPIVISVTEVEEIITEEVVTEPDDLTITTEENIVIDLNMTVAGDFITETNFPENEGNNTIPL